MRRRVQCIARLIYFVCIVVWCLVFGSVSKFFTVCSLSSTGAVDASNELAIFGWIMFLAIAEPITYVKNLS